MQLLQWHRRLEIRLSQQAIENLPGNTGDILRAAQGGQNVPTIGANRSGTTNLTTANQHTSHFNLPLPWCYRPELVAQDLRKWLQNSGARTLYIDPGSPWVNGYCESFNSKLRDEFLNGEIFYSI